MTPKCNNRVKNRTDITSNVTVQARIHQVAIAEILGLAVLNNELGERRRHGASLFPFHGIFVLLSSRARRGTDFVQDEERVISEEKDKSLAHRTCGTKNTWTRSAWKLAGKKDEWHIPHFFTDWDMAGSASFHL